jgi:hypothetical protein
MGYWKQQQIERQELEAVLCTVCQDRQREVRCLRCDEPTVCRFCADQGHSTSCDYCRHIADKDD